MKKLSIICPTIHQTDRDCIEFVDKLQVQLIKMKQEILTYFSDYEVIIIENELVNYAWCKWVKQATWDIILILNDDIIIEEQVFETLNKLEKGQVYCPYFTRWNNRNKIYSDNWNNIVWFCFWMYKEDWKDIPSELKIWYWDNYIFEYMKHNILWWGYIHHHESRSLNDPIRKEYIDKLIENDKQEWNKVKCMFAKSTN